MEILIYLVPFTILWSIIGLIALFWSIRSKQYDDLEGSANRILFDNHNDKKPKKDQDKH
jgi:cbb3-type cytochrome oxidase maturation protein